MELKDIRYFCVTAELEHVSRAAQKLGVSQPYLSRQIGIIESEIGANLFDKVGRDIRLSPVGDVFYRQSKRILAEVDNLYTEIDYTMKRNDQAISLHSNTEAYTPDLIVNFQRKKASYGLKFSYSPRDDMIKALISGETNFALCCPPIPEDEKHSIKTEIVLDETACILLPPGHKFLGRNSVSYKELDNEPLVTSTKGGAMRTYVDINFEKEGVHPKIVCETSTTSLIIRAVQSGLGYAFMTHNIINKNPELKPFCVELDSENRYGKFGLSYISLYSENRNVSDFRKFCFDYFNEINQKKSL